MEYPAVFPQQSRAAVEAEELRAGRDFDAARQKLQWTSYGPGEDLEAEVRRYILRIYAVFVRQACKPGCFWSVERIRSHAREFLRDLTSKAWLEKGYDTRGTVYQGQIRRLPEMMLHGGGILPTVMSKFEKSVEWRQCEDAILVVAEAQALAASGACTQTSEVALNLSAAAPRKRGRPAIPSETKRQAWEAKQKPGNTLKDVASILYSTQHPTLRQVKNVPAILKHYQKSLEMKKS
jgi:hypothetical protein